MYNISRDSLILHAPSTTPLSPPRLPQPRIWGRDPKPPGLTPMVWQRKLQTDRRTRTEGSTHTCETNYIGSKGERASIEQTRRRVYNTKCRRTCRRREAYN